MARTFTFQELIDRVRSLGGYETLDGEYGGDAPSAPSDSSLLRYLDLGHRYAWERWSEADAGWNLTRQAYSLVPGSGSYALPVDCHEVRAMDISHGQGGTYGYRPLRRATTDDDSRLPSGLTGGEPDAYRLLPDSFELLPAPGQAYSLRLGYCPSATRISSSLQSCPGDDGFDEVVVYSALVQTRQREEKDTSEFRASRDQAVAGFKASILRRDRSAPMRMLPNASLGRWDRRRGGR